MSILNTEGPICCFLLRFQDLLLARSRSRLNQLTWERRKMELSRRVPGVPNLPIHEKGEPYTYFQRQGYKKQAEAAAKSVNVTLPDPTEQSFLDWSVVQSRSFAPVPVGPRKGVSPPIRQRRGSTVNLKPLNTAKAYRDPSLSRSFKKVYTGTDQSPPKRGGSTVSKWDGQVRNSGTRPSYLSTPRKAGKRTPEPSIHQDPYSFY